MTDRPTRSRAWLAALFAAVALALTSFATAPARADDGDMHEPSGLHEVKGKHYVLHTDLDDKAFTDDLAKRMDLMYDQYCKALKEFAPKTEAPPFPVYVFKTKAKYTSFLGPASAANTGGMFVGGRHSYLTSYLEGQGRDALRRTLQHEAFHQFAWFNITTGLPTWLNEGMAQVFEEGIWTGKDFILGQIPPRRIRQLRADVDKHDLVTFDKFLFVTNKEWGETLHKSAEKGATYYNEAWAIAYFLSQGNNPEYRKKLVALLKTLHEDENADTGKAFHDCFPDVKAFQAKFDRWAVGMQSTPEATLLEREETLGDFLIALSNEHKTFADVAGFRNEVVSNGLAMSYTRGAVKYKTDDKPVVYFSDLNGRLYPPASLYFQAARGAPLPDIICRPNGAFVVRVHFYKGSEHTEHEVSIAPS